MKKYLILFLILFPVIVWGADSKITALTEDTAPTSDDLVVTVNAPGSSPANRKATLANLFKWALVPGGSTNVTTITGDYAFGITLTDTTNVTFPTSGTLATTTFKPSDLAISSQAAGDILYFNGTNWVRLAKDSGKYLKSGDAAVSWDSPTGSGDVLSIGNCESGACLDGTSDGGTNILFYDAQGATTLQVGDNSGAVVLTLPTTTGTLATTEGTLANTVLDDTKGNGDTAFVWSADKIYDQLALKQNADADLTTWAGITPSANLQTFLGTPNAANFETAIGAGAFASDLLGYANAAAVLSGIGAQASDADLTAIAALSCSQDQIIKKGASAWECGTDKDSAGTPTNITVADTTDTTSYVALFESATGDLGPKTDAGITYNAGTGMLTVTGLTTGSGGITTAATAAPTNLFNDSDAPGADKEIAKIVGGYVDGADGSENGTLDFNVHQAGTTTSYVQLDGKNVQVEINKPLVLLSSDDPDTSAANQMTFDTDGWLRVYSTSQKALARIQEEIHVTVYKPNDMDDAQRDHFWIWSNESGMSFIVTGWKGWSTSDDTTLTIYEEDADGANDATVDAVEIATGSGPYTGSDTTITGATVETGHLVYLDFDDTDAPALVKITIYGYYNADVN